MKTLKTLTFLSLMLYSPDMLAQDCTMDGRQAGFFITQTQWLNTPFEMEGKGTYYSAPGFLSPLGLNAPNSLVSEVHRSGVGDSEVSIKGGSLQVVVGGGRGADRGEGISMCGKIGFTYDKYSGEGTTGSYREIPVAMIIGYRIPLITGVRFSQYASPTLAFYSDKRNFITPESGDKRKLYLDTGVGIVVGKIFLGADYRIGEHQFGNDDVVTIRGALHF